MALAIMLGYVGLFVYDDFTNYLEHGNFNQAFLAWICILPVNITRLYDSKGREGSRLACALPRLVGDFIIEHMVPIEQKNRWQDNSDDNCYQKGKPPANFPTHQS